MKKKLEGKQGGLLSKARSVVTSTKFIVTLAALVVIGTFGAWQYHNMTNVDRVFWGMVDNSMQTTAYVRHTQQKSGGQSVDQIFETATAPQHKLFSDTVFTQTGVDSATAVTENIGTPTDDYVRYTSIETAKNLDFSAILGVWGITEAQTPGQTTGQLYNQAVLGIIPTGNISAAQRREIIKVMHEKNAYSYSVVETKRSLPFGRPTYTLRVIVNPVGYITALKQFAGVIGLNHLEQINPEDYAQAAKLSFTVSVDGWTHQMTATDEGNGAKVEVITGRNLRKKLPDTPTQTIPVDELQQQLQSVQ
jgi:hypothetical protein